MQSVQVKVYLQTVDEHPVPAEHALCVAACRTRQHLSAPLGFLAQFVRGLLGNGRNIVQHAPFKPRGNARLIQNYAPVEYLNELLRVIVVRERLGRIYEHVQHRTRDDRRIVRARTGRDDQRVEVAVLARTSVGERTVCDYRVGRVFLPEVVDNGA